ncbi:MAG: HD domain-containing phosphohydrolase [Lachnospiraceae bacterium]
MLRSKKGLFIFNIVSLCVAGLICVTLYSYLQYSKAQPLYTICPNSSSGGRSQISNNPKDDYSAEPSLDGKPQFSSDNVVEAKAVIPENAGYVDASSYQLEISVSKQWVESVEKQITGAEYDAVFYNNSPYDINNWEIQIIVPNGSRLDSSWNGDYSYQDSVITILPLDYNRTIYAGDDITFGFILMNANTVYHIKDISIIFYRDYKIWRHPLFWITLLYLLIVLIVDISYIITCIKLRQYNKRQIEDRRIIDQSLSTFANIIDAKDIYTKGHSLRVAVYSREIARRMGISEEAQQQLYYIALLHDIGKIGISDNILQKPGALTPEERRTIEQHVVIGGTVLKDFTSIPGIAEGAMYHHERYDGTGYAKGLSGDAIPLFARIICVADAFDAMSSARCYRKELDILTIINEIKKNMGTQFDPAIAPYMLEMIHDGSAPISIT